MGIHGAAADTKDEPRLGWPLRVRSAKKRSLRASSRNFQRRRRRRIFLRRAAALAVVLLSVEVLLNGVSSSATPSGTTPVGTVSPVETGNPTVLSAPFSSPSDSSSPDMARVWDAAVDQEPSPSLAILDETMPSEGKVSLTFDDGPDPLVTPQILDTLQAYDAKATFFVVGRYVEQHPDIVRRIVEEGHILGNHSNSHTSMSTLTAAQLHRELRKTQEAVDKALGYHYPMFVVRPPYGHPYQDGSDNLPLFKEVVREHGLFPVLWTPSPHDYLFDGQPGKIIRRLSRLRTAGKEHNEVLLLHDTKQQTADALPGVIELYKSEGMEFASVHELLANKYLEE